MRARGCLNTTVFLGLLALCFGLSSYFWFTFFVRGRSIGTPDLVGLTLAEARAISSDYGLTLELDPSNERHSDKIPPGSVVWQNQRPGTLVKRGTLIIVGASLGPLVLRVPEVAGQTPRTALLQLSRLNLRLGSVARVWAPGKSGIVATDPPVGSIVSPETPVSILEALEASPGRYVMPDLIEKDVNTVRTALELRGLRVAQVRYEPYPGLPDGRIIRQSPVAGSPVSSREPIALVVSRLGEGEVVTP